MKLHGALAALTLVSLAAVADAAKTPTYAITKARVVTVSGAVLENATVVLRDGLVVDVGANVAIPKDARIFDGTGLTLTPGLIDAYSGAGLPAARPAGGPGGGGGGAGPATPPANPIDPASNIHERVRASEALKARDSGITTIVPIPREGLVFGAAPVMNLNGDKPGTMVVKANVGLAANLTTLGQRYPGSLMGAMTFFRQALMDGAHHRADVAAYEKAPSGRKRPAYDPGLDVWADVAAGATPLLLQTSRVGDLRRAFALGDEFKIKLILAGNTQAFEEAALLKERKPSLLVSVNFDPPRVGGFFGGSDDDKDRADIDKAEKNPGLLHREGLKFALVSGFATDFLGGIRKAIEKGLPRDIALRAVTLTPAEILGVADRMGSLDKGKIANVVAWTGDPLTKDAKIKMVFVDGELYQPEEKPAGPQGAGGPPRPETPKGESVAEVKPMAAPAPVAPSAPDTVTAITNAKIMTVGAAGIIDQGTILIKGGKITAVGKDISVPAGATVIDASGRVVTPGIIDAHSHTAVEGGVNECTNIITAEVRVIDVLDPRDISIYRQLAGGVTAANVLHGSCNSIGGQNATIKLRWGADSGDALIFKGAPPGIKFALGENPKRASFGGGARRYPATRMGVEVSIRDAFLEAKAYKKEWDAYNAATKAMSARKPVKGASAPVAPVAPRKNLQMEALVEILEGKRLVHAHSYRADEILMLIDVANEMGFKIATFQHVLEGYKVATEIAKHGAGASTFSDWWAYKMEAYDAIPYNAAIMAGHGVSVSLNSDSDELARRLYWEAAKAVRYGGVSEDEAFKMITINPAKQLGIDKWVGSIEVGKDADLAIFRAHPFAADTRVEMTLVDGKVMFDRSKDVAARTGVSASLGGGK